MVLLPKFLNVGWYAILFGVTFYFFPGPQLTERYKQKVLEQQTKKATSSTSFSWWAKEFPWFLLICLVLVVLAVVT